MFLLSSGLASQAAAADHSLVGRGSAKRLRKFTIVDTSYLVCSLVDRIIKIKFIQH